MDMNNGNQYSLPDIRHLMAARTHFPLTSQPSDTFLFQRNMAASPQPQYEHIMAGTEFLPSGYVGGYHDSSAVNNVSTTTTTAAAAAAAATSASAIDMDQGIWAANDGGNSRWPRQETLTLLEIRSRLDSKFKEANQKGPLWDEVSRIMAEEHGYQRSGKKCREKFENLYKYYKKTKEGKAGRHDGKHYRFFRQLEAICGEASNKNNNQASACGSATQPSLSIAQIQYPRSNILKQETQDDLKLCESTLSFSTSSEFETSSSENNEDELSAIAFMARQENKKMSTDEGGHRKGRKSWKEKVKEFVDSQMRKIIETQDAWMEKTVKAIEDKEQERIHKEEEWRKQEEAKFNREHEFWARDRAWLEARDAVLMDAIKKFTGKGLQLLSSVAKTPENNSEEICISDTVGTNSWTEPEFSTLLKLTASMDMRYHESEYIKEGIWEEISAKMASLGYDRSAYDCRHKWENMNIHFHMATESNKKRKEELRTSNYFQHSHVFSDEASKLNNDEGITFQLNDNGVASSSQVLHQNNSFQIMMNGEGHWWGNCDLSLNKEKNQHG